MPFAKSHGLPNKADRKPKRMKNGNCLTATAVKYEENDRIVDNVYVDICNGVSRYDCLQKLQVGAYGKEIKLRKAQDFYNAAFNRLAINADIEAEKLRQLLYSRYESLLEECVKKGDMYNARGVLDSIAKTFLGTDKPQTAIQINNNKDGITVNFGFTNNNEENDNVEGEG